MITKHEIKMFMSNDIAEDLTPYDIGRVTSDRKFIHIELLEK